MPRVTVLQLDTSFPRIPGELASVETYLEPPQIIKVASARVRDAVTKTQSANLFDIFLEAARKAYGDVIITSCGFLAPFQERLQHALTKPLLASVLNALPGLDRSDPLAPIPLITFDSAVLSATHFPKASFYHQYDIIGLQPNGHLRQLIEGQTKRFVKEKAEQDVAKAFAKRANKAASICVLECTNLPPYKNVIRNMYDVEIYDILTQTERLMPRSIKREFL